MNDQTDFVLVSRFTAAIRLQERGIQSIGLLPVQELNNKFYIIAARNKVSEQMMAAIDRELMKYQHPERQILLMTSYMKQWLAQSCNE